MATTMRTLRLRSLVNVRCYSTPTTSTNLLKKFYITTPIFYVNAAPHIGHLYSMLIADTRNRWEKLAPGRDGFMLTGTDEHGLKIQATAKSQGMEPKELVDKVSQNFAVLAEKLDIRYDRFIRTTDTDHVDVVKYFWNLMMEKGFIYTDTHGGWYSVSDETFYPETQIEEIEKNGQLVKVSTETRNEVVYQEETNYFFKLSQFQDQLVEFLESHPDFIKPSHRYRFILNELKNNKLADLSISRPSSRLEWSIEVPDDPSQKIYVWFDALLNYLTATGYPRALNNELWPATHIIGKDIIRFHCIYWPIFLMAAGVELPTQVIVHSHWLCDGFKMSKSLGNVVDPIEISEYYGVDPVRFFLVENSSIEDDCKFNSDLLQRSRDGLLGKYCNLMSRMGAKSFNIEESVEYYSTGKFDNIDDVLRDTTGSNATVVIDGARALISDLNNLHSKMDEHFKHFQYNKAIQEWWSVINQANAFFQSAEPWKYNELIKNASSGAAKEKYQTIKNYVTYLCADTERICSILIQPVMPVLTKKILDRLQVVDRTSAACKIGAEVGYGKDANSKKHGVPLEKIEPRPGSQ
ncbi:Methionine--tRNA ligase, mitochondrial [Candida viswanathii]|uniref:Methionine--tRNA ligase, mitochondrial n=1 Tax=Candida viswanathii TaxID=5486 RepID=A0A367YIY1_9ASCO|nr:Methionine--tRNA ligase, mitochondrial [Candida viswanathii]